MGRRRQGQDDKRNATRQTSALLIGFSSIKIGSPSSQLLPINNFTSASEVALLILRTRWEDQTLQEELPDYRDYKQRVRYKLIPGVW